MTKKRIYDLAKEYGMTGKDLAGKLKDMGFTQVKSHMTALDDFEVLEVQAKLEAYGIINETNKEAESQDLGGGLIVRRKKKRKPTEEETPSKPAEEPAPEPEEEAPAPVAEEPTPEPVVEPPAPEPTPEPVAEAPAEPEPVVEAPVEQAPAPKPEPVAEVEPVVEAEPVIEPEPVAEAPTPEVAEAPVEEAPAEEAPSAEPVAEEATEEVAAEGEAKRGVEIEEARDGGAERRGKVVGFIDLSKIQTATPKRPDSRRLRGANENFTPNVQPTFGRSRKPGQRGDVGDRDALTAQQLREREAGRFLRRRGGPPQRGGGGRRGGRGGGRQTADFLGSPMAGKLATIEEPITVKKLAEAMSIKGNELLRAAFKLLGFGQVNINSLIDAETAELLAGEFEVELTVTQEIAAEEALIQGLTAARDAIEDEHLIVRAPAVAFLGHVDHGKTTLIDTIRASRIATGESGGITQHIGAYRVETKSGNPLCIVDTPGHAAFSAMRARGASAVDIVVLVVAADDGVMPQTREALAHAKAAGVLVVVAINKCDRPEANPEKVRNELSGMDLIPEDWGGSTAMMEVSALTGDGVEELLERVFLESEVLELTAHEDGPASGVVLEAEIQQGKGKVAHLLIQDGSLQGGQVILAGEGYGRVRSIHNDRGQVIKAAGPSMPVEVTGLNELPTVGDRFYVVDTLDKAQEVAVERSRKARQMNQVERASVNKDNLFERVAETNKTIITLVVKTDVQGSAEVIRQQIQALLHDEVEAKVLLSSVGQVVDSDVDLAANTGARILAFHVSAAAKVRQAAERQGVEILNFNVIYELLDYVKGLMEGELAPEVTEEITGHAEIKRIFKSSRMGNIAGCMVLDGTLTRDSRCRLVRDGQIVFTGMLGSLRREAEDAKEVREGFECGLTIKNYNNIEAGDILETYKVVESARTLELKE
ncbi:MAG: translation initiation factor IF-2 [Planctomycetota bacterium]|nr:translation initiation factor IF-2 [Planctomycetota bacterium]